MGPSSGRRRRTNERSDRVERRRGTESRAKLTKGLDSVPLGGKRRGKVEDNHLKEGVSGGEEPKKEKGKGR